MPAFLPAPLHRALLPLAHILRHRWRRWRKAPPSRNSCKWKARRP